MEGIDDLELASKSWNRMIDSASKVGYREGVDDGAEAVYQESFDKGYEGGFKLSFLLGVYKGLMTHLPKNIKHPSEIEDLLKETKRGCCYICNSQANNGENEEKQLLETFLQCQKDHTNKVIEILHNYFDPLMTKYEINCDLLNLPQ